MQQKTMSISLKILFFLLGLFYFLYTLSYALYFSKRAKIIFSQGQMKFHLIMIWVIPFIWLIILKSMMKPYDNKYQPKKGDGALAKSKTDLFFTDVLYGFFHHGSNSSSSSSHDSGGQVWGGHDSHDHGGHFGDSSDAGGGHH